MISITENDSPGLAKIPSPEDLVLLLERLMTYWRGAAVRLTGLEEGFFAPESPEFTVRWAGRSRGRLALRFDASLYPWLMRQRDFKQLNLSTETEMLKEMTALYALYLVRFFSMEDLMEAGPLVPRRPAPAELADRPADTQALLKVESHLVEIRLWVDPPPSGAQG